MTTANGDSEPALSPAAAKVRNRRAARRQAEALRRRRLLAFQLGIIALAVALIGVGVVAGIGRQQSEPPPTGTQSFPNLARDHTPNAVAYDQNPPVGGPHNAVWQNCGFYAAPIANEAAVHSLEHGVVWITYRPDLPSAQIDRLKTLAESQSHLLVSPIADQPAPVVATAWGEQIQLDSAADNRLHEFVDRFRLSPQAPEPGASCAGGTSATK